jgi:hypothetical protein
VTISNGGYEEFTILGFKALQSVESQLMFRRKMSPPFSGSKNKPRKRPGGKHNSFILKMEATCSIERSVGFQRSIWHYSYIPEDRTLH